VCSLLMLVVLALMRLSCVKPVLVWKDELVNGSQ
jgi:hypothetical protein